MPQTLHYAYLSILPCVLIEHLIGNASGEATDENNHDLKPAIVISRLTVVSREAKKKQHACASSGPRDHYSELFTRMAALKF